MPLRTPSSVTVELTSEPTDVVDAAEPRRWNFDGGVSKVPRPTDDSSNSRLADRGGTRLPDNFDVGRSFCFVAGGTGVVGAEGGWGGLAFK